MRQRIRAKVVSEWSHKRKLSKINASRIRALLIRCLYRPVSSEPQQRALYGDHSLLPFGKDLLLSIFFGLASSLSSFRNTLFSFQQSAWTVPVWNSFLCCTCSPVFYLGLFQIVLFSSQSNILRCRRCIYNYASSITATVLWSPIPNHSSVGIWRTLFT